MCSPCMTVSSPVLTTAVSSLPGTTSTRPRMRRAAPTPPASETIIAEPYRQAPLPLPALVMLPVPMVTVALDGTQLLGPRTGIGTAAFAMFEGLAARDEVEVLGYALSARAWRRLPGQVPRGVRTLN